LEIEKKINRKAVGKFRLAIKEKIEKKASVEKFRLEIEEKLTEIPLLIKIMYFH